jgi:hypothetical protein
MQFYTSIFAVVFAATALLPSYASAQAFGDIKCKSGSPNDIQAVDWQNEISNLLNGDGGGLSDPFLLRETIDLNASAETIHTGSFSVLVSNGFVFESTHVSFSSLAQALQTMKDQCCGSFLSCIGGTTQVLGDSGLPIDVIVSVAT